MADYKLIALTGGPCGGKTTLIETLRESGYIGAYELMFVPESATILMSEGMCYSPENAMPFQKALFEEQLWLESGTIEVAQSSDKNCAIICDRGALDGAAYCEAWQFDEIIAQNGFTRYDLLARYDLVIHMQSAAIENPANYGSETNDMRYESLDEAILQEQKTLDVWSQHPQQYIFGGYTSFDAKIADIIAFLENYLA